MSHFYLAPPSVGTGHDDAPGHHQLLYPMRSR